MKLALVLLAAAAAIAGAFGLAAVGVPVPFVSELLYGPVNPQTGANPSAPQGFGGVGAPLTATQRAQIGTYSALAQAAQQAGNTQAAYGYIRQAGAVAHTASGR